MALIKRAAPTEGEPKKKISGMRMARPKLELSLGLDEVSEPPRSLFSYSMLIYGAKKIGKTSLAARFPNAYFLRTEPGTKALRVRGRDVPDWDHFVGYVDLLVQESNPEMVVVVDVIDKAYDMIYEKVCDRLLIRSPTDENDFGATWKEIRKAFAAQVKRLVDLPGGVVFLSHETEKEVEVLGVGPTDRIQPTMGKQALGEVEGIVDIIGYYGYAAQHRYLWLAGTQTLVAGARLEENFVIKGGKPRVADQQVTRIPMGRSSQEAFDNLMRAFNNQQETVDGGPAPGTNIIRPLKLKRPTK